MNRRHLSSKALAVSVATKLIDIVFPPACPACGRLIARTGALCRSCWQSVRFIERPYCEVLGIPFSYDLGHGFVSAEAIANPPDFDKLRSACLYDGAARAMVHKLKYKDRTELSSMMALWMVRAGKDMLDDTEILLPVPLHFMRFLERRFNQSAELARQISILTGKPVLAGALYRKRNTVKQFGLGRKARKRNVAGAFRLSAEGESAIFGRSVAIVDDVYTTGATVSAIARILKRAGARQVTVLTFASALPDII